MGDSVAQQIYNAGQALLQAVSIPGKKIAERLNSTLNQFLTWPFRAGPAYINDAEGHKATFDTAIYTSSERKLETYPVKLNADTIACAIYVVESLGQDELQAGYESIALLKRQNRTPIPEVKFPINKKEKKKGSSPLLALDTPMQKKRGQVRSWLLTHP